MIDDNTPLDLQVFSVKVWEYYHVHGRHDLPWRQPEADGNFDPYKVTVSEVMLQQTQVTRVVPKYTAFLARFPTVQALAAAPLGDVLRAWSGLGYNRRAKFLHETARLVLRDYRGEFPAQAESLERLPGIGSNTAGAILAYAYDQPAVFVETNIRTVFIHHFFPTQVAVDDKAVRQLVSATLDYANPRQWYWALMDYGSSLKRITGSIHYRSKSYTKQAKFTGSKRQVRGQVIRLLGDRPHSAPELQMLLPDARLAVVLEELLDENLIRRQGTQYWL